LRAEKGTEKKEWGPVEKREEELAVTRGLCRWEASTREVEV